jgi:hypothetical protein
LIDCELLAKLLQLISNFRLELVNLHREHRRHQSFPPKTIPELPEAAEAALRFEWAWKRVEHDAFYEA